MKVFCFLLAGCLTSCVPSSIYYVVNDQLQLSNSPRRKVFVLKEQYFQDASNYVEMLNGRKWIQFDQKVKTLSDERARSFLRGLRLLVDREYYPAFRMVNAYPDADFDCQMGILKADCLHELKSDSISFRKKYQAAFDCSPDPKIKSIAEFRFRAIKYGY